MHVECQHCGVERFLRDNRSVRKALQQTLYTCPTCLKRIAERQELLTLAVDWSETAKRFGHGYESMPQRGRLVVSCARCQQPLELVYRGPSALKKQIGKATHKKCFRHDADTAQKCVSISAGYWENQESYKLASAIACGLWRDPNYRAKVTETLLTNSNSFANQNMHEFTKGLWEREEFRNRLLSIMQSAEHRLLKAKLCTTEMREANRQLMIELWTDDEYRAKLAKTAFWKPQPSKLQRKLIPLFNDLGLRWEEEYLVRFYHFDYFLPDNGILIEVQGNYWHTRPENMARDKRKRTFVQKHTTHKLLEIWEDEFKNRKELKKKLLTTLSFQSLR